MRCFGIGSGFRIGVIALLLVGCGSSDEDAGGSEKPPGPATPDGESLGEQHAGVYHLGPVNFSEQPWHNACAPGGGYRSSLEDVTGLGGEYIAGLSNEHNQGGAICDACILIKTATGRSIVARVVTYGVETGPNDIDVSQTIYDAINTGENPRSMTWEFAKCPDLGPMLYEFKMGSNPYWTALWVRNPRVPITNVEVQGDGDASFTALAREGDGTVVDGSGFGGGEFTLRITGMDGQSVTETLPSFSDGELVTGSAQFE